MNILHCPMDGAEAKLDSQDGGDRDSDTFFVVCTRCGTRGPIIRGTSSWAPDSYVVNQQAKERAIAAWNRRT